MGQKAKNAGKKKQAPTKVSQPRKLAIGDGFIVSNTREAHEALGELTHISNKGFFVKGRQRVKCGNLISRKEYLNQTKAWINLRALEVD